MEMQSANLNCQTSKAATWPSVLSISSEKNISFHPQPDHLIYVFPGASPLPELITPFLNWFAPFQMCFFFRLWLCLGQSFALFLCRYFFRVYHVCWALTLSHTRASESNTYKQLQWQRAISVMFKEMIHQLYVLKPSGSAWLLMSWESQPWSVRYRFVFIALIFIRQPVSDSDMKSCWLLGGLSTCFSAFHRCRRLQ